MKTTKLLTVLLALFASIAITSCVEDDDYNVPNSLGAEENQRLQDLLATATEVSIADVKAMYANNNEMPVEIDTDIYVKGYVTSSDATGNFFREFFIQDSPSSPTAGLKVSLNLLDNNNKYNIGREVYINLKGLFVGEERVGNGVTAIGGATETDQFGTTIVRLNENQINLFVLRSSVTATMVPLVVTPSQISDSHVGLLVGLEDVQFAENLNGLLYFDPIESFDTKRALQACEGTSFTQIDVETSSFSNFRNEPLPTGNGTLTAVVNKTFNGASVVLALNTTDDVSMTADRCEPLDINDFNVVFEEDFTGGLNGWTVVNSVGTRQWVGASFGGESYARASAFLGSGNPAATMVSWLVSPAFDFDAQPGEQMVLEIADAFSNAGEEPLSAYYSTDYVLGSDPTTATWVEVGASQIAALPINTGFFDNEYDATSFIDLSAPTGTGYIAFVYDSNSGAISSTRDISDVKILSPQ